MSRRLGMLVLAWVMSGIHCAGAGIERLEFPRPRELDRAEVYSYKAERTPQAVLVLCPGFNGNGKGLISDAVWQQFARENNLGLMGISFASPVGILKSGGGYYIASKGSGQVLLDAIKKAYGRPLPILIYGFSGGAHFTSRFVEWKPEQVIGWCAYSAAWWDEPLPARVTPPGIVACGEEDSSRYGSSMMYFKQGRAVGKPWLWISLPSTGHTASAALDGFVRRYFRAVLSKSKGGWVDVDREISLAPAEVQRYPSLTGWLPDVALLGHWQRIHEP